MKPTSEQCQAAMKWFKRLSLAEKKEIPNRSVVEIATYWLEHPGERAQHVATETLTDVTRMVYALCEDLQDKHQGGNEFDRGMRTAAKLIARGVLGAGDGRS